ncbi:hypothetical protein IE53DRAFT_391037 [Violaceomyces palustris]|uniref:Uncharacterized protein n=1 Tax=Violaceomyces palustris TaxID=1673888 RepID=A0ACD0NLZ6_9BASI|nr:hypothetical protein IE53DRAFT_391037 [Violaceomyces palustris]
MNRRGGAGGGGGGGEGYGNASTSSTGRFALLSAGAYPSSSRSLNSSPSSQLNGTYSLYCNQASSSSNPHLGSTLSSSNILDSSSDPYSEYQKGAPKKEPGYKPQNFASSFGFGRGGGGTGGGGLLPSYATERTAQDLEEQNDARLDGLSARVKILKEITTGIGQEVRDSTKDMGSLTEAFENTSAFLGNTFNRMNKMARRQGGWFCNMMIFLLFVSWIFVFLWWWRR